MCGIVGIFRIRPEHARPLEPATGSRMVKTLWRRGPDGEGQWYSNDKLCWLGHKRLAIIDLSSGDQPMSNEDGTVWTVFNGEIYNYKLLRTELTQSGHVFRTASDTEVLVHGFEEWGCQGLVNRLRGIFAFAIYDTKQGLLFLARDQLGVKPLYWWNDGNTFLFASEIKALLAHPLLSERRVSGAGVAQFLVTRYVSRPHTMFDSVHRLPEGTFMTVARGQSGAPVPKQYWDVRYGENRSEASFEDSVEQLDSLLTETVEMQLMSDVPVGAQLSGGVDSSVVVALMDKVRRRNGEKDPIKTYSVGFDVEGYSELPYAQIVASRYGTNHREIHVGFREFFDELPLLSWIYDEPVGEPSAVPTYFMCMKAKQDVSVMLTGEGADEQFGGYRKYVFEQFSRYLRLLPNKARTTLLKGAGSALPFRARRLRSIVEILALEERGERYASWYGALDTAIQRSLLNKELRDQVADCFLKTVFAEVLGQCDSNDDVEQFLYCDIHTRLVDDLLVKGDRMSMGASVEARVPFLDHHVVEFAARLPRKYKVNGLRTKIILKRLAEQYVPKSVIYRRKVGFTVPLSSWFVGPMRDSVRNVLLSERCLARGYWEPSVLIDLVEGHLQTKVDREQGIWVLLALEIWHRLFVDDDGSEDAVDRVRNDWFSIVRNSRQALSI
ncbi:MAG: asparagine synthase (glutamine-hydrolyzing) [Sulfuricaulis sp.]|uniref:asparagine synthase (glutamine-hydrolyzing) n=1 Tax=Sulfuricaulis sp. TaxID=2003553 RepID=UPI0034A26813